MLLPTTGFHWCSVKAPTVWGTNLNFYRTASFVSRGLYQQFELDRNLN